MKAKEVLEFVSKKIGVPLSDFPDGGFSIGSPEDRVKGALVTWMATSDALCKAVEDGLNLVICHEGFFFYEKEEGQLYRWTSTTYKKPTDWDKHPNNRLRNFAIENKLTVLHIHYGLDRFIIGDSFMKYLGINKVVSGGAYEKIYELPELMRLKELVSYIGQKLKLTCIRFVGEPDRNIRYVGNCWGGNSLSSNRYWMRRAIEDGAQAIVCGELDESAMFFARECKTALIETSHVLSEGIGLKEFTGVLSSVFKNIPIKFYELNVPFKIEILKPVKKLKD